MNSLSLKQIELANLVSNFNDLEIEKVLSFAKLNKKPQKLQRKSLSGIWNGLKFEDIGLESEIRQLRTSLANNLNKKPI